MNRALANLAAEMAKMKLARESEAEPDSPEQAKTPHRRLEAAGDNMVGKGGCGGVGGASRGCRALSYPTSMPVAGP